MRHPRASIVAVLGVIVAVIAAYWGAMSNGAVWDDVYLTTRNPNLASLHGLVVCFTRDLWRASALGEHSEFYRPLPLLDYALDRAIFGNTPNAYHLGNLIAHGTCSIALGAWLSARTRSRAFGGATALIFATLPLASEPVFWISGRFDSLGLLFVLVALTVAQVRRPWVGAVVVVCSVASVACKEPFVMALLFYAIDDFIIARRSIRSRVRRYAAIALAEVGWLFVRHEVGVASASTMSHVTLIALGKSYLYLCATFGRVFVDASKLDAFHAYAPLDTSTNVIVAALVVATMVAAIGFARRRWTEVSARLVLAGWLWTLLALVPVTVAGPTLEIVGDRYAYVPSVGLVVMFVALGARVVRARVPMARLVVTMVVAVVVVVGAIRCRARAADWASDRTLVLASLRTNPSNAYALGELGSQYALAHDWTRALPPLLEAISKPGQTSWRARTALCVVYLNTNRLDEAEDQCRLSLDTNPDNPRAWLNLATVETRQRRWPPAVRHADSAIALRPTYAEAHFVRALALANMGRLDEARSAVARALEIDPNHPSAQLLASRLGTAP